MKLSITIPSLYARKHYLSELLCSLVPQCGVLTSYENFCKEHCSITIFGFGNVEIIIAIDDQKISTGKKRNLLLSLVKNEYQVSIDDDDYIYPYYIEEILNAIQSGVDCLAINGIMTTNGQNQIEWYISKDYADVTEKDGRRIYYKRFTNHITPVKTDIAKTCFFDDKCNAEDKSFSQRLIGKLNSEYVISKPLYHYRFLSYDKTYT